MTRAWLAAALLLATRGGDASYNRQVVTVHVMSLVPSHANAVDSDQPPGDEAITLTLPVMVGLSVDATRLIEDSLLQKYLLNQAQSAMICHQVGHGDPFCRPLLAEPSASIPNIEELPDDRVSVVTAWLEFPDEEATQPKRFSVCSVSFIARFQKKNPTAIFNDSFFFHECHANRAEKSHRVHSTSISVCN